MRSLQILLITWSLSAVTKGNNNGGINEAEFREMCSFIKLLQKRPNIPTLEAQDSTSEIPTQALRAVNRIRILNASTADASTYDSLAKGEEFAKLKENRVVVQMGEQKWAELVQLWKDNQGQFFPDPRKLGADELRVIHGKLGSILQKAENTYEEIKKLSKDIERVHKEARVHMLSAAYGEEKIVLGDSTKEAITHDQLDKVSAKEESFDQTDSRGLYAAQCSGAKVGKNIVSDITCLCALKTDMNNDHNLCVSAGGLTSITSGNKKMDVKGEPLVIWNAHKQTCLGSALTSETVTKEELLGILPRHRSMLGKGALFSGSPTQGDHAKKSNFFLGKHAINPSSGTPTCDGSGTWAAGNKGVCVDYSTILIAGDEIPWVSQIQQAVGKLNVIERKFQSEVFLFQNLERLEEVAETVFETMVNGATSQANKPPGETSESNQIGAGTSKENLAKALQTEGLTNQNGFSYIFTVLFLTL